MLDAKTNPFGPISKDPEKQQSRMRLNLHLRGRDSNASLKNESVKRRTYFKQQSTEAKEINYNPGNLIKHKKIYHKKKLDRKLVPQKTVGTTN
jgi:hypothetical protein